MKQGGVRIKRGEVRPKLTNQREGQLSECAGELLLGGHLSTAYKSGKIFFAAFAALLRELCG
jgi:hypothetical protein